MMDLFPWLRKGDWRDLYASEYPHKCPRCGKRAYVGFMEVTHADEMLAYYCPARRGK